MQSQYFYAVTIFFFCTPIALVKLHIKSELSSTTVLKTSGCSHYQCLDTHSNSPLYCNAARLQRASSKYMVRKNTPEMNGWYVTDHQNTHKNDSVIWVSVWKGATWPDPRALPFQVLLLHLINIRCLQQNPPTQTWTNPQLPWWSHNCTPRLASPLTSSYQLQHHNLVWPWPCATFSDPGRHQAPPQRWVG